MLEGGEHEGLSSGMVYLGPSRKGFFTEDLPPQEAWVLPSKNPGCH